MEDRRTKEVITCAAGHPGLECTWATDQVYISCDKGHLQAMKQNACQCSTNNMHRDNEAY